jgi:hypothetical protein
MVELVRKTREPSWLPRFAFRKGGRRHRLLSVVKVLLRDFRARRAFPRRDEGRARVLAQPLRGPQQAKIFLIQVHLDLTRFRGRPTRPSFGAEVAHRIEQKGGAA